MIVIIINIPKHDPSFSLTIWDMVWSILASSFIMKLFFGLVAIIDDTLTLGRPELDDDDDDDDDVVVVVDDDDDVISSIFDDDDGDENGHWFGVVVDKHFNNNKDDLYWLFLHNNDEDVDFDKTILLIWYIMKTIGCS